MTQFLWLTFNNCLHIFLQFQSQYKKGFMSSMSSPGLRFFVQFLDVEASLRRIRETLDSELGCSPPLAGSYTPRKGEICAAKFTEDNQWYRARIENINRGANQVSNLINSLDFMNLVHRLSDLRVSLSVVEQ